MSSSTALLALLLALGVGGCGILWGVKNRNAAQLKFERELSRVEADAVSQLDDLSNELAASEKELQRLQGELADEKRNSSLIEENNTVLLRQRDRLELRITELHARAGVHESGERQWSDPELDGRIRAEDLAFAIRELKLSGPPKYTFSSWDKMRAALGDGPLVVAADVASNQSRAFGTIGFVNPGTDVRERTLDLLEGQLGAALFVGENEILFNTEGNTQSVHDRTALAVEVVRALQDQHFGLFKKLSEPVYNEDARNAIWALAAGDSNLVRIRFQLQDTAVAADELLQSPTRMTKEQFQRVPAYIRETFLFPLKLGETFCQRLHEKGKWGELNLALSEPPMTTAEILHPELFLGSQRFEPQVYAWQPEITKVSGQEPIWNNVAGELGIALMLNQSNFLEEMAKLGKPDMLDMPELVSRGSEHFAAQEGSKAAAGWKGDRYLVFANDSKKGAGEDGSDHLLWRSQWQDSAQADEFSAGIRRALGFRYKAEDPLVEAATADAFSTLGGRSISVSRIGENEVLVINAGSADFAKALATKSAQLGPTE